jgi:hypothetical protein
VQLEMILLACIGVVYLTIVVSAEMLWLRRLRKRLRDKS